jgi:transcriptional regulator with XRE-family HTH domain
MTLPDRIRAAAGRRSLAEVARIARLPRATVHRLTQDGQKRGPSLDTIRQLAEALGVDPGWLAYGREPEPPR